MAESTHALALATSRCLFKTVSTSKSYALLITLQQNKLLGVRLLARKHKKVAAGLLGFLQLTIFQMLKRSLDAAQSKVTAHVQTVVISSGSKSE
jgi:hypothetical protein